MLQIDSKLSKDLQAFTQPMQKKYDYVFKVILIGSTGVGKTAILRRYADNEFNQSYLSTIGIDFRFKSFYLDQKFIKLQIWDTAGQERFRNITQSYYNGSHAVIIVYDPTDSKSFTDVRNQWLNDALMHCDCKQIYCLANKCDLKSKTYIAREDAQFCHQNNIKLFPVSAKTNANIGKVFEQITKELVKVFPEQEKSTLKLTLDEKYVPDEEKKCGC